MSAKQLIAQLECISKQPAQPFNPETLANPLRSAPPPYCKAVVAAIKALIKRPRVQPTGKLSLLRVFCACMRTNNPDFVAAAGGKILRRLGILAAHNKARDM